MKDAATSDERVDVAAQAGLLLGQRRLEPRQVLVGAAARGQAGDLDLDDQPGLDELVGDAALERGGDRRGLAVGRRLAGDEHALAVADLDDAEHREAVQRLADGRSADAELPRQLALRGHLRARRQLADRRQELLGHRLRQLAPRCRRERELGVRILHRHRIDEASGPLGKLGAAMLG